MQRTGRPKVFIVGDSQTFIAAEPVTCLECSKTIQAGEWVHMIARYTNNIETKREIRHIDCHDLEKD